MQLKIFDMGIVKDWFGTMGEFIGILKGPGAAKPSEDPAVLTKWIVLSMYVLIVSYAFQIAYYALGGGNIVDGVYNFVVNSIYAVLQTWITWYAFVKREPNCCFCCIVCIEDWKPMHTVFGILMILGGVSQCFNAITFVLTLLSNMGIATIMYIVFTVFIVLYAICTIATGLCLVKIGAKKSGIEVPGADKVGAPEELSCA